MPVSSSASALDVLNRGRRRSIACLARVSSWRQAASDLPVTSAIDW
jgi:hypothetical protein